jgi:uncharacterized protein YajQ (UPF0234 family)
MWTTGASPPLSVTPLPDDPPMSTTGTIRRRNPRHQGDIGVGAAIAWFSAQGYRVFVPLSESQAYDLVIDDGTGPLRVQVKTTTCRGRYGRFVVSIETAGGNQSFHTRKAFDNAASDLVFVLTDDGDRYVIPSCEIEARRAITLGPKWAHRKMVVGEGFEPSKAEPSRLQRDPFGHSGIPPCDERNGRARRKPLQPRALACPGQLPLPFPEEDIDVAENSFDVVAEVDKQEVDNALNQASKEIATRFDFKNTQAEIRWSGEQIHIQANSEERVQAALDVLKDKLVKRKVSLKSLEPGEVKPGGKGLYHLDIDLVSGIPTDKGKEMVKLIKNSKLKVTPTNMGDHLRVSSKSRDDLQEVQALLRANDQDLPLRFTNYK